MYIVTFYFIVRQNKHIIKEKNYVPIKTLSFMWDLNHQYILQNKLRQFGPKLYVCLIKIYQFTILGQFQLNLIYFKLKF